MAMELDIIKTDTTWNDAAGSINNNFLKLKQAIATLIAEGGGLDEEQLATYLQANGYTTEQWIALQKFIKLGSLDTEIKADSVNAVQNKAIKSYVDKVAHEAEDAAIRGALEGLSADEIYIKYIQDKMSLLLAQDGGLGTPEGMQGLGIVSIPEGLLSDYAKKGEISNTFATIAALNLVNGRLTAIEDYFSSEEDADTLINKWNEIVAFLNATEGTTLDNILSSKANRSDIPTRVSQLENDKGYITEHQDISGLATKKELNDGLNSKQNVISDLDTIRAGAALGATALQAVPDNYVTEKELTDKGYITSAAIANKVDKEDGKGLSSNDYTDAEKSKLANIAVGAEVNVQADWNATSGDAFIKNKPSLHKVATSGSYNDLENKPTIPAAVTESTVAGWGFTKNTGTYIKPSTGIPKSDLASDVQTSLGKADTALQEHQSLAGYATQTWVNQQGFLKSASLNGYAKTADLGDLAFLDAITSEMVTGALGFTPFDSAAFTKTSIKNALGIADWVEVLTDKNQGVMQARGRLGATDANTLFSAGSYEFWGGNADTANSPSGYATLLVSRGTANNLYFTSQLLTDSQGHLHSRMNEGGDANGWRPWRTILDDTNSQNLFAIFSTDIDVSSNAEFHHIGYGLPAKGWKEAGPALSFGTNSSYYAQLQTGISTTEPSVYYRVTANGVKSNWYKFVFTEGNYQISSKEFLSLGQLVLHRNAEGGDTYLNYGPAVNDKASLVVKGHNIWFDVGDSLAAAMAIQADKTVVFYGGITLNGETITSWDDLKASGDYLPLTGGTISGSLSVSGSVYLYSNLKISAGGTFQLGNEEPISSWDDLKSKIAYSFSEISSKPTTLSGYGITDAVKAGSNFPQTASDSINIIGYSGADEGWPASGPAMRWGTNGYYARLQVELNADNPRLLLSGVYNNAEYEWVEILTDKNFSSFGIANMSNNASGSANDILTSSVNGVVESLTNVPIYYGNLLTFAPKDAYYQSQLIINYQSDMAIRGRSGSWSDWAKVVTDKNFASYGVKAGNLNTTGSVNDITVPSIVGDVESLQNMPFHYCNILTITTTPHYYVGQIAIDYAGRMAVRGQDGATWSAWRTILDTNNIGTTSLPSLNLNGETITSWAEVRRNWGGSYSSVERGTSEVEVREYNRKTIVTTLTSDYTVTFRLLSAGAGAVTWTIRFKTGSTTPHINIESEYDISSFIWQNGENILNNLQPNREYRIYIEGNLVMYTIF